MLAIIEAHAFDSRSLYQSTPRAAARVQRECGGSGLEFSGPAADSNPAVWGRTPKSDPGALEGNIRES